MISSSSSSTVKPAIRRFSTKRLYSSSRSVLTTGSESPQSRPSCGREPQVSIGSVRGVRVKSALPMEAPQFRCIGRNGEVFIFKFMGGGGHVDDATLCKDVRGGLPIRDLGIGVVVPCRWAIKSLFDAQCSRDGLEFLEILKSEAIESIDRRVLLVAVPVDFFRWFWFIFRSFIRRASSSVSPPALSHCVCTANTLGEARFDDLGNESSGAGFGRRLDLVGEKMNALAADECFSIQGDAPPKPRSLHVWTAFLNRLRSIDPLLIGI
mmetsp:Transcript_56027/g.135592  ORF Transcript_56027/g.135592 Transcript_56027/m.135592 type:complete len:266 (-) Transcript_56027:2067-2864(-)